MSARVLPLILACAVLGPGEASANVINDPPHSHLGPPGVTFPRARRIDPTKQHQHRTGHNPAKGVLPHGNIPPYEAHGAWMNDRTLHSTFNGHPDFAHGHLDNFATYRVMPAVPGGDITEPEADRWNDEDLSGNGAIARTDAAFALWMRIGNQGGPRNWPLNDNDHVPGTGVPWHSSLHWKRVESTDATANLTVRYAEASGHPGCTQGNALGCFDITTLTIFIDDDMGWFYGESTDKTIAPTLFDFYTTILHEIGHALGLMHFGKMADGAIMGDDGLTVRGGTRGILHAIDASAEHGILDLYAICKPNHALRLATHSAAEPAANGGPVCDECGCFSVPLPATLLLIATGLVALAGFKVASARGRSTDGPPCSWADQISDPFPERLAAVLLVWFISLGRREAA